jgi:LysM repeat protein
MAVSPAVPLAAEKQRRLCLVDHHVDCATYGAAVVGHAATGHAGHSRPLARMTPVILDHGRFDLRLPALRADRPTGQAALVAVLAIAFVAILLARPAGDSGAVVEPGSNGAASAGASIAAATDAAVASPSTVPASEAPEETDRPVTSEQPAIQSDAPASAAPSLAASSEPAASGETYRVKSGDTLSAIAARFGTTTGVLVRLNGITDPSKLKVGQVLKLP